MLKALPSIFWYFMFWQRIQLLLTAIGLVILLFAALLAVMVLVGNTGVKTYGGVFGITFFGLGFVFLFPMITAGLAFRSLVSRRQYMTAPQSGQSALMALLLFTLMAPLLPYSAYLITKAFGYDSEAFPVITLFTIFNFTSIFHFLCQARVPKTGMWQLGILPWLIIIILMNLPEGTMAPLFHPFVTCLLFLFVVYGWITAFKRMSSSRPLSRETCYQAIYSIANGIDNSRTLNTEISASLSGLPAKSLYYNILTSNRSTIISVVIKAYLFPLLILAFWVSSFYFQEKSLPENFLTEMYLSLSGFIVIITGFRHGELIKRSKLLWLRTGCHRSQLWKLFNAFILQDLFLAWLATGLLALLATLSGIWTLSQTGGFLLTIIGISFYFTWLGVFCSMRKGLSASPAYLAGILIAVALILERLYDGSDLTSDIYQALTPVSLFLLVAGLILRQLAAHTFTGIDWLQVKPTQIRGRSGS